MQCFAKPSLFLDRPRARSMSREPIIDKYGTTTWFDSDGKPHRDGDLPAVVYPCDAQIWYQHGKIHREGDLPAVVYADGTQVWCQHGEMHRDGDLPAVVWLSGGQEWWVDGRQQSSLDRELTRAAMAQAARWSPLRAAFVGVVICKFIQMHC
jgi:hypothetical protein